MVYTKMEDDKESKEGTKPSLSLWNPIKPHEDAEHYNQPNRKISVDMKNKAVLKEIDLMKTHARGLESNKNNKWCW